MSLRVDTRSEQVRSLQHTHIITRFHLERFQLFLSPSTLLRLTLISAFLTGAVLTSLVTSVRPAEAAPTTTVAVKPLPPTFTGVRQPERGIPTSDAPNPAPHYVSNKSATTQVKATPAVTSSTPLNGLGDGSIYSFVDKKLSNRLDMKVNVASGNLVLHSTELQIKGTGLDVTIGGYYNSQSNLWLMDHGVNWNFTTARGATLDLSAVASGGGITLYAPNGLIAYFAAKSGGGYTDAPSLDATLSPYSTNRYELYFHKSGQQWYFNQYGTLTSILDKNERQLDFSWNDRGDWVGMTDTQGRTISTIQNSDHQVTTVTDNTKINGVTRTITYGYDSSDNLTSITDVNGKQTIYDYDSNSELTSIKDPQGHTTTIAYVAGKVSKFTDANGHSTTFTYNSGNTVVKDANGHSTTFTYQSNLQVTGTTDALGHSTTNSFDPTTYNVNTYSDDLTTQAGQQTKYSYDVSDTNTKVTGTTDATGATSTASYYSSTTLPSGDNQNVAYQPNTQTDAQGNETDYAYDASGNTLTQTNKTSTNTLQYSYYPDGTVSGSKDANGNVTTYGEDSVGNQTSVTPPAPMGKTTLTYDGLSRETSETDGNGHTTRYSYDALDRITKITYSDSTSVSYSYDNNGNLLSQKDSTGTTSFVYDALNRQTKKTLPGSGPVIVSTFDNVGNLTSLNDGTGTTSYTYDAANRVITLKDPGNGVTTYGYDTSNHKTSIVYPNGTGMLLTYDLAGRETSNAGGKITLVGTTPQITGTPYTGYSYNYVRSGATASGEVLQSAGIHSANNYNNYGTWTYQYDSQNQLRDVVQPIQHWALTYDANGNLKSKTYNGASTYTATYTYNGDNELTQVSSTGRAGNGNPQSGSATYSYDGNGNETSVTNGSIGSGGVSPAQSHTYNAANQDGSGTGTATGSSTSYSYGYSGTNQSQRVTNTGATAVYTGLGLSSEKTTTGTYEYVRCSCGTLTSERTSAGQVYYYLFNGQGSVVAMTDSNGNEVATYDYDPFGGFGGKNVQSGVYNPWGYAGGYTDSTTGLIKFGIRYYDLSTGRWTQRTPVGGSLAETLKANSYTYAENNPTNEVDPSGRCVPVCLILLALGVGALGGAIGGAYSAEFTGQNPLEAAAIGAASGAGLVGLALATGGGAGIVTGGFLADTYAAGIVGGALTGWGTRLYEGFFNGQWLPQY